MDGVLTVGLLVAIAALVLLEVRHFRHHHRSGGDEWNA